MSDEFVEAIYESGTLRLVEPELLSLTEGQRVQIVVRSADDILQLARQVYEGLTEEEIGRIESIALDRSRFFGTRTQP